MSELLPHISPLADLATGGKGTALAAATTVLTGGVGAGFSLGTAVSAGLTAASAFASVQAGNEEAAGLKLQERQAGLNSRLERLEGKRKSLAIQGQLDKDLASQNAIFASRGALAGEGSAAAAEAAAKTEATKGIKAAQFGSELKALSAEQRAENLRIEAKSAKTRGKLKAVSTIANFKAPAKAPTGKAPPLPTRKPARTTRPSLLSGLG